MNTSVDTFADFVAALADVLDDPDIDPAVLATRLHLSRSHLDHVVAAAGGESPGKLRRRVLLERAAWRLQSSDITVLDAAIEAGYNSHEAFTRAFGSAYGQPPASWRNNPTAIRLPSPNGVHFYPPGGLFLPGRGTQRAAESAVIMIIEWHVGSIGDLIERSRALSEEQRDRPITVSVEGIDDNPTVRRLLARLVGQLEMWNCAIESRDYDFGVETDASLDELADRLATVGPRFVAHLRDVDHEGRWQDTFLDTLCDPPLAFSYLGVVDHVLKYSGYRKTLVAGALRTATRS